MKWFYHPIKVLARFFLRLAYSTKIYGLNHFTPGGVLLASNHASFYDPPIVATSWPQPVHFLARGSLFRNFLFGKLIRSFAAHPIRGGAADAQVFRLICNLLLRGEAVLIFPEGTRSKTGEIGTIKPGIFLIVSRTKVPIVPVYVHGSSKVWGRGRRLPKLWGKIACVFGSPIHAQDFAHLGKKEAEAAICEKIYSSLLALQHWYLHGAKGSPP